MPLIKYYKFRTCYDGSKEFNFPSRGNIRYYPDEFLIAHILNKYLFRRFGSQENIQFMTVVEPWYDDNGKLLRLGNENKNINPIIIPAMEQLANQNKLLLVPFLYKYHHPGIAIDLKNKHILYLDPFGHPPEVYSPPEIKKLLSEFLYFSCGYVQVAQQKDNTSCGPILTASMIKFIEEYQAAGKISDQGFEEPKTILATDRMFQMYVNNTTKLDDGLGIDEVMLADTSLWEAFLAEQNVINDELFKEICSVVENQKLFINSLNSDQTELGEDEHRKIDFIKRFQSRLTELIFLKEESKEILVLLKNYQELFRLDDKVLITKPYLFSDQNFHRTLEVLGLVKENKPSNAVKKKTVSYTLSWKFTALKIVFPLIKHRKLGISLLFLLIASGISFSVLTVLGLSLSPWLALPCALLFLAVLVAIKIAHNEYHRKCIKIGEPDFPPDNNGNGNGNEILYKNGPEKKEEMKSTKTPTNTNDDPSESILNPKRLQ